MEMLGLGVVLLLVLIAEFVNGWTDAPNAIATVVSTRTLSPRVAIVLATTLNIIGTLSGTAVATTIGKDIVHPEAINLLSLSAAMIAVILWSSFTAYLGLPTSETHALVAALAGAGFAMAGPNALLWSGWTKVILGLVFSTLLGAAGGFLLASAIRIVLRDASPSRWRKNFSWLQIFSAGFMALSHGSNDGQKFVGAFSLALLLGGLSSSFTIPIWVIFLCALVMGLGTSFGGMRIIQTMGYKMLRLETYQGFAAETAAATTIVAASSLGIPLSTTHTISTAIIGTGMARSLTAVRWGVVIQILQAWILTFPCCGLLAYLIQLFFNLWR